MRKTGRCFCRIILLALVKTRTLDNGKVSFSLTVDFLLSLKIKYKEEYEKSKGKAMGTTDSRLLHSLQVAKMSSEVNSFLPSFLYLELCYFKLFPGPPSLGTVTF